MEMISNFMEMISNIILLQSECFSYSFKQFFSKFRFLLRKKKRREKNNVISGNISSTFFFLSAVSLGLSFETEYSLEV